MGEGPFGLGLWERFQNRPRLLGFMQQKSTSSPSGNPAAIRITRPKPMEEVLREHAGTWSENTAKGIAAWMTGQTSGPQFDAVFESVHDHLKKEEDKWVMGLRSGLEEAWGVKFE